MPAPSPLPHARTRLSAACILALLATALPTMAADTCSTAPADAASTTSQRLLQALVETNGVPGMGAAVWRDGRVAWTGCAGLRDVEARAPVRRDTVFRLASVSKVIATTAAAKLIEDGRLDIDAPVGATLPWLTPAWSQVTVRQLAAHISGAPHYAGNDLQVLGKVRYPTAREAVGYFSDRALLSTPGTKYSYSSWGYTLIGAMIEARSGQHFLNYVRQHVTDGLAILADGDAPSAQASVLYDIEHGPARRVPPTDMSYTWPGGGLAGTPEALATFGGRLLDHRIVGAARWEAMLQPTLLADGTPVHERDYDVGFGWRVGRDADGNRIAHHAGTTTGARSVLLLWPGQDTAVGVLSNAMWVSAIEPTAELLAAPFRTPPASLTAAACPTGARLAGTLKDERFELDATFRLEHGRCMGEFVAPEPLRDFFSSAYAWPEHRLRIVALADDGTLSRAALATPYGLYDLRAVRDGEWTVSLNATSTLTLTR